MSADSKEVEPVDVDSNGTVVFTYRCFAWGCPTLSVKEKTPTGAAMLYQRDVERVYASFFRQSTRTVALPAPGITFDVYVVESEEHEGVVVRLHFGWSAVCPGECAK